MSDNNFKFYGYKIVEYAENNSDNNVYKQYTESLNELVEAKVTSLYSLNLIEYILVFASYRKNSKERVYHVSKYVYDSVVNYLHNRFTN